MEFNRDLYLNQIKDKIGNSLIKVITGARRSGKSYLMNEIFYRYLLSINVNSNNIIRFAFDNDEDIDLLEKYYPDEPTKIYIKGNYYVINSKKFRAYIKDITNDSDYFYLLLDEIQLLDSFVGTLNAYIKHNNFDVYVTGSNSELLSSEIETKFRGRKSSIHVLPLSFSELLTGINETKEEAWKKYIVTGGIPIVYKLKEDDRYNYLRELCSEVYLKDIIGRKKIKDPNSLNELFSFLASCIGSIVSPTSLEKAFKSKRNTNITNDTIDNYINHLTDSFVVSKVYKYNIKGKEYINSPYKVYFEDLGVRNAKTNFNQIEETHILENIIYNELRFRGYNVFVGEININEKTEKLGINNKPIYKKKALEVDFIATKKDEKYYIQSCLNINDSATLEREKKSLLSIKDSFKKIIVTKDALSVRRDENGIVIMDVFDFLLNIDSLGY